MAGAPLGNQNGVKGKTWRDALHKALTRYVDADSKIHAGEALDALAVKVVSLALAGHWDAIQEIGNRLDGKPAQALQLQGEDGLPLGMAVIFHEPGRLSEDRVPAEARLPLSS